MVQNQDSDTENPATRDPLDNFESLSPRYKSHSRISILQDFHLSTNVVKVKNMKIILIWGNLVLKNIHSRGERAALKPSLYEIVLIYF